MAPQSARSGPPATDPFAVELLKNALVAVADEMALTVSRTARSSVVKEALDFSTALFDRHGRLIAQGTCLPLHLGARPAAVENAGYFRPIRVLETEIARLRGRRGAAA
jgi:N-methylhydantoinase B